MSQCSELSSVRVSSTCLCVIVHNLVGSNHKNPKAGLGLNVRYMGLRCTARIVQVCKPAQSIATVRPTTP